MSRWFSGGDMMQVADVVVADVFMHIGLVVMT